MHTQYISKTLVAFVTVLGLPAFAPADAPVKAVKKSVLHSTLNQPGTKPFHLKAVIAPSREPDRGSNRNAAVEIWWKSPTQWKREVRSPEFHQIAIRNGANEWQKNEGDYFPEWLRETSVALIEPVPFLDQVLQQVKDAEIRKLMGSTHYSWTSMSTDGTTKKGMGAGLTITDSTGLLSYGGDLGWGAEFKDFKNFHRRIVAQTVNSGTPEVTAKVTTLEELRHVAGNFFSADLNGGDSSLLRTVVVEETTLRKNVLPAEPLAWPALPDGPLEGAITTAIVVDRSGKVRDVGSILSDNPQLSETAGKAIAAMQFKPYLQDGIAVQVVSRITMAFKTTRPSGVETFDSAHDYFERGRHFSFPAADNGPPYVLRASFQASSPSEIETGQYVDTWISDTEWRREATLGGSRFIRARKGDTRYQLSEGPHAELLRLILKCMEPIPALDTLVESDWRIKRDTVRGFDSIRVLAGYEGPPGVLDPEHSRAYWFDEHGQLLRTYFSGLETQRSDFISFAGVAIAHTIRLSKNNMLLAVIRVTDIAPAEVIPNDTFQLQGYEWRRAFTDEVR
jgi:hypothetical protein